MKDIKIVFVLFCIVLAAACKPEDFGPIGEPRASITQQLQGTWAINKVTQIDENAVKYGFPYKTLDITTIYPYKDFSVTFNVDNAGNPTTFTSVQGSAPQIIKVNDGSWSVDEPQAPKTITLTKGTESSNIELGDYTSLRNGKLNLKLIKYFNGKPVLSYQYELVKK